MKLIQAIILSMLCTPVMASCNNPKASNRGNQTLSATNVNNLEETPRNTSQGKGVAEQIKSVNKAGKAIFLVVYDKKGADKDKAIAIAKKALLAKSNSVKILELNTTEASNKELVTKFRLTGAPLPLIIVIDKNGTPTGGLLLSQATPDALSKLIPSPKFSEVLKALNDEKSVFVVAYKETMIEKTKAIASCKEATKAMNNGATIVLLNIENKAEKLLIDNLRINTIAKEPIIYVINKSGQITGTFTPKVNSAQLSAAANKVISGCGSGCASGCN
ncbi:MAG: hypothetical protein WCQ86_07770 [Bacteroidaceae bacterium]